MQRIFKIVAALAVVILLAFAAVGAVRLLLATVSVVGTDGGDIRKDPMFADEAELTTRPPELSEESGNTFVDNSANWEIGEENPVTMTAGELAREEQDDPA